MSSPAPGAPRRRLAAHAFMLLLAAATAFTGGAAAAQEPAHSAELDAAIIRAAKRHGVPEHLVRRIVMRESRYNPRARNHSFWGLMQISYPTARSMGFKGTPEQLLNPVTNLAYAVPYLANAFVAAGRREDAAVRLYASGYYSTARTRGVLGLLRTADSKPLNGVPDEPISGPTAVASADSGGWSLFGSSSPAPAPEAIAPDPQQLAYAAPAVAAPAQAQLEAIARAAPTRGSRTVAKNAERVSGKNGDDDVAMAEGRDGAMVPPKRWQRDGGTTVIARGEQGLEHVAAYRLGNQAESRSRRSRKTAAFAQLDTAAAATTAAATTATASDAQPQPTSFYATAPQGPAPDAGQQAQQAAAQIASNEAAGTLAADADADDRPKHRRHRHRRTSSQ